MVVIDSAKALRDFVSEQELRTALYDLASRVSHTEALLLLVGEYTPREIKGGVEFPMADGIVQLAYEPHEPVDRRWLRVVKLRGGDHLVGKHSFRIGQAGCETWRQCYEQARKFARRHTLPFALIHLPDPNMAAVYELAKKAFQDLLGLEPGLQGRVEVEYNFGNDELEPEDLLETEAEVEALKQQRAEVERFPKLTLPCKPSE